MLSESYILNYIMPHGRGESHYRNFEQSDKFNLHITMILISLQTLVFIYLVFSKWNTTYLKFNYA